MLFTLSYILLRFWLTKLLLKVCDKIVKLFEKKLFSIIVRARKHHIQTIWRKKLQQVYLFTNVLHIVSSINPCCKCWIAHFVRRKRETIYNKHIYSPMCSIWSLVSTKKSLKKNPSGELFRGCQLYFLQEKKLKSPKI